MPTIVKTPRVVTIGDLGLGGGHPIRVQSMWKSPLNTDVERLAKEVDALQNIGCELLRFAVPDEETANLLADLQRKVSMPLVADIHFDFRLALICLDSLSKIRINPGNIGSKEKVEQVLMKAAGTGAAIRIGINAGSLPRSLRSETDKAKAMIMAAEQEMEIVEKLNFRNVLFSLKSSDIKTTIVANRNFAESYDYPLHLGVTEAGPLIQGVVKSTAALVPLLADNIGSTIRISLSGPCADEVIAAREILSVSGKSNRGVTIISCPRCGRAGFDVHGFLEQINPWLMTITQPITVAIMGCVVNGPEEARYADIGITGAGRKALIFRNGKIVRRVTEKEAAVAFYEEMEKLCLEQKSQ